MSRTYIPVKLRRQVRAGAHARCGYCHAPEAFLGMPLDFEHLLPEALGGLTVSENLWLACTRSNDFKGDRINAFDSLTGELVSLFHPRTQRWTDHFAWSPDGILIDGVTPTGRATVEALQMNNAFIIIARQFWVEAGRWPPSDDAP